jgi:hypothetical protein
MSERKHPPPPAPITRSSSKVTHAEASGSNPSKDHVAATTLDNTLASIRSETIELIDTAIERSHATTHELIVSQFDRLTANFGPPHGQPTQRPVKDGGTYSRSNDRTATHVYEPDHYNFDDEQLSRGQLDDISLSRSLMRTQGPTFTADSSFPEFRRDYINYLRAINPAFPELLEGASPPMLL